MKSACWKTRLSNSNQNHLVIFAKAPRAGTVKTRLAAAIGTTRATQIYRQLLQHTLSQVGHDPRWTVWLAVSPDAAADMPLPWHGQADHVIKQGRGDLGDRMERMFVHLPRGPVVIIGSDLPQLRRAHIVQAFKSLNETDVVFGPAEDGGYWLVGHRRRPYRKGLFNNVHWSSATTLSDTLANLNGQSVSFLQELRDLDTVDDLDLLF